MKNNKSPYSNVPGVHIWEKFDSGGIGSAIAFVYNVNGKINNEHVRFITAAPDLLEACKYAIEQLRNIKGKTFPIMPILNAISKAEGNDEKRN
jgi:hypothetical protein